MLPSETMIWQPEFTDKTLSRKPGAVHSRPVLFIVIVQVTVDGYRQLG
ncbi:putative transposase [Escherichia coli DEC13C]|nr:putative transposase [Escherichia coli DEC13C]